MGDLRQQVFYTEAELKQIVAERHPGSNSWANGGRSLWRLFHDMQIGDLVIISAAGSRVATMRVTGDYYFLRGDAQNSYEHRRKAEVVQIDPNQLWQIAGKAAPGEGIYTTLIRCTNPLNDAEFAALVG